MDAGMISETQEDAEHRRRRQERREQREAFAKAQQELYSLPGESFIVALLMLTHSSLLSNACCWRDCSIRTKSTAQFNVYYCFFYMSSTLLLHSFSYLDTHSLVYGNSLLYL